jgi:hypothetical protein
VNDALRRAATAVALMLASALGNTATAWADNVDGQLWVSMIVQGPVGNGWLAWGDSSFRWRDDAAALNQIIVRGAVGRKVTKDLSLWGGYAHSVIYPADGRPEVEYRGWQQASFPIFLGEHAKLTGRFRLEQRWFDGDSRFAWRARQLFRLDVPLGKGDMVPGIMVKYEGFYNIAASDLSQNVGIEQHRGLLGIAIPMAPRKNIEVTYFEQRFVQPEPDRVNRALNIMFNIYM